MPRLLVLLAVLATPALGAGAANAATIVVNTEEPTSATKCGLVNAITAANTNAVSGGCIGGSFAKPDLIEFALPAPATIMLGAEPPAITGELAIAGAGEDQLFVSGGDKARPFRVDSPKASITGLTITDGKAGSGGGVFNEPGSTLELAEVAVLGNEAEPPITSKGGGGGIFNMGTLTLARSSVAENVSRAPVALTAAGGGIYNEAGQLIVEDSTIKANEAIQNRGMLAVAKGGGVFSNAGELTLLGTTVVANKTVAIGTSAGSAEGGGIQTEGPGKATVARSTVVENDPRGLSGNGESLRIANSTFAGNVGGSGLNSSSADRRRSSAR